MTSQNRKFQEIKRNISLPPHSFQLISLPYFIKLSFNISSERVACSVYQTVFQMDVEFAENGVYESDGPTQEMQNDQSEDESDVEIQIRRRHLRKRLQHSCECYESQPMSHILYVILFDQGGFHDFSISYAQCDSFKIPIEDQAP